MSAAWSYMLSLCGVRCGAPMGTAACLAARWMGSGENTKFAAAKFALPSSLMSKPAAVRPRGALRLAWETRFRVNSTPAPKHSKSRLRFMRQEWGPSGHVDLKEQIGLHEKAIKVGKDWQTRRRGLPALIALVGILVPGAAFGMSFVANTYTLGVQGEPVVAAFDTSEFVVVWESDGQDGDDLGVFARVFDSQGNAIGAEFVVNQTTTDIQSSPTVAADGDGFVVVWEEYDVLAVEDRLLGRIFDSRVGPVGDEFRIDTEISDYHIAPVISAPSGGRFVVAWDDYSDVFAQLVGVNGTLVGSEFRVNAATSGYQSLATVAMQPDGGFVIAWTDGSYYGGSDGDGYGIFARRFGSNGFAIGSDFQVNVTSTGDQFAPNVVAHSDGGFTVLWESYDPFVGDSRIASRRFDSLGVARSSEFELSDETAEYPSAVAGASAVNDEMVVVWSDLQQTFNLGVVGRRVDSEGVPIEPPLAIDPLSSVDQASPDVTYLPDGRFVAVWEADGADGDDSSVVVSVVGNPFPSETPTFTVLPTTSPSSTPTASPSRTPTATLTATAVPTATPSQTNTNTPTETPSNTPTQTRTATRTATRSLTPTQTRTATRTATRSLTPTQTRTATRTATPSLTPTNTKTVTRTLTRTRTPTATHTETRTPSRTHSGTPTNTASSTNTSTRTTTATQTPTSTVTRTGTQPATATFTRTLTPSATPSITRTRTSTATRTLTRSATRTRTGTATRTSTRTGTATRTATTIPSLAATPTTVPTASETATRVPTGTRTPTPTRTFTPSRTHSQTRTPTRSRTPSQTGTFTRTRTNSRTPIGGATQTHTGTPTPTQTRTPPPSRSRTRTRTPTRDTRPSGTPTATPSVQPTSQLTPTPKATTTPEPSAVATFTAAATSKPTDTPALPTATGTLPSATATARETTPPETTTPTHGCAGDCDGDMRVSVSELVLAVNVALGNQTTNRCLNADRDGNGRISIAELIGAVNRALGGCV